MQFSRTTLVPFAILIGSFMAISCREKKDPPPVGPETASASANAERQDLTKFRGDTRQLYNNRKFDELEALADRLHKNKERFANGDWKILQFYDCMDCREDEPESMWRLHDDIHKEWIAKHPQSVTARVAHGQFMIAYAWHARGSGYSDTVTEEGWQLFRDRLAIARKIFEDSKSLAAGCPVWYHQLQKVALGQGWPREDYEKLFNEAKASEPEYFGFDTARAYYLLPRWHGEPGDWEAAAEAQAEKQGDLGLEIYARVIIGQTRFYDNIFDESKASWRKAKKGFDGLRVRYPDSRELLNTYCRLACFAGDQGQAKKLFAEIGDNPVASEWRKGEFAKAKQWASAGK